MAVKTWSTSFRKEECAAIPCTLCRSCSFIPHFNGYVRCSSCSLVQVNPQPLPINISERYNNGSGQEYLAYEKNNEAIFLRLGELALQDAGFFDLEADLLPAGPRVLDIGSAIGALPALLKNRGWAVQCVEISVPQALYCRERGLETSTLPLEDNHFLDQSFDAVIASHLIEHLNDPGSFVREVHRILKPNGRFYITTPNIDGFQAKIFGSRWRSAIFDHLYLFSAKTLRLILEQSGFTVERIKTWGGLAAGIAPVPVKKIFDAAVKPLGIGDVMIVRARCQ